jgi:hypothetical protein
MGVVLMSLSACGEVGDVVPLNETGGEAGQAGSFAGATAGSPSSDAGRGGNGPTTGAGGKPAGPAGCECPGVNEVVWEDVGCACGTVSDCPDASTVLEPQDTCHAQTSGLEQGPYVRRGCGRIEFQHSSFSGGVRYQFDATTRELLALRTGSDVAFGACAADHAYTYTAGTLLDLKACDDFTECLNCKQLPPEPGDIPACSPGQ